MGFWYHSGRAQQAVDRALDLPGPSLSTPLGGKLIGGEDMKSMSKLYIGTYMYYKVHNVIKYTQKHHVC